MVVMANQQPLAARQTQDLNEIVDVGDVLPWRTVDISVRPYRGFWSMNPSVHFDGESWRCVIRCADYAMPGSRTAIRGELSRPGYVQSKNAMLVLDPTTWKVAKTFEMEELDEFPRVVACANRGFEDMRLFRTAAGGLQGIAASSHLSRIQGDNRPARVIRDRPAPGGRLKVLHHAQPAPSKRTVARKSEGSSTHTHPEQVIVSFDDKYNVVDAVPLRGDWNNAPQKNWSPFDNCDEPRFLYSIGREIVFSPEGPLGQMAPEAIPTHAASRTTAGVYGGTELKIQRAPVRIAAGRIGRKSYSGIRGGTQLIHVGDALAHQVGDTPGGAWLGLGHEMRYLKGAKHYWHTIFMVDSSGRLLAKSPPIKLSPTHGIEFAAGLALDGDLAVISYGVDDMQCKLAITSRDAMLELLEPVMPHDR